MRSEVSNRTAKMLACATATVQTQMRSVQNVADILAEQMAFIHGGTWRAVVDHGANTSFVLIRPNNEEPTAQRGGANG